MAVLNEVCVLSEEMKNITLIFCNKTHLYFHHACEDATVPVSTKKITVIISSGNYLLPSHTCNVPAVGSDK